MICEGERLRCFIDGILVFDESDPALSSGGIGLYNGGGHSHFDNVVVTAFVRPLVDIKPGSCPNPVNVKSSGVLPVSILGFENFDVNEIDFATITLEGLSPIRHNIEDSYTLVTNPADPCNLSIEGADGFDDVMLKFDTQDIVDILGEVEDGELKVLTLTGLLYDGTQIEGQDQILIKKKGKLGKLGQSNSANTSESFSLLQNFPNPFNPETEIGYTIPSASRVVIDIFNVAGIKVATLKDNQETAGYHSVRWNGKDNLGRDVAAGIYLCRITAGDYQSVIRMLLLR